MNINFEKNKRKYIITLFLHSRNLNTSVHLIYQYSDHESSESADVESAQLQKTVTRGRRNAEREPDPC